MLIEATMRQVSDYNITDEIEWGVSVGESYTYDYADDGEGFEEGYELRFDIVKINETLFEKYNNGFSNEYPIYMTHQTVYADLFVWNGSHFLLDDSNMMIGAANNFYP